MAGRRILDLAADKVLGIGPDERDSGLSPLLEGRARELLGPAHAYLEEDPSVAGWCVELAPDWTGLVHYAQALFPSASWLRRYNWRWLAGDVVAGQSPRVAAPRARANRSPRTGITIGLVVVPQALAYAALAHLPPAYGLYTSFTGAALYWVFGTSKDVVIGVRRPALATRTPRLKPSPSPPLP